MSQSEDKRVESGEIVPSPEVVLAARRAMASRRLFGTGPFPRADSWRRDLVDKWSVEDDVAPADHGSDEVEDVEEVEE